MRRMQGGDPSNGKDSVYIVVGGESKGMLSHICGMLVTLLLVHRSFLFAMDGMQPQAL